MQVLLVAPSTKPSQMLSIPWRQDSTWQGRIQFQPASVCLFLKYLNSVWVQHPESFHKSLNSRINCCLCLLNNPLLLCQARRPDSTSHLKHRSRKTFLPLGKKRASPTKSKLSVQPAIIWLIDEPSGWWQTPPHPPPRRQDQVLSWHQTKPWDSNQRQILAVWEFSKAPLKADGIELKPVQPQVCRGQGRSAGHQALHVHSSMCIRSPQKGGHLQGLTVPEGPTAWHASIHSTVIWLQPFAFTHSLTIKFKRSKTCRKSRWRVSRGFWQKSLLACGSRKRLMHSGK